jgi:hydrophobic/amphiphilic exporter-1 (mainly G- bacteria), HAE1 family
MVGGLVLSQALTLFTTPVVYLYLDRLNERISGQRRSVAPPGSDDGALEHHHRSSKSRKQEPATV